jgi:hypothetical protein
MESKDASSTVQVGGPGKKHAFRAPADDGINARIRSDLRLSADAMLSSFNDVLVRLEAVDAGSDLTDTVARIARRFEGVHREIIGLVSSLETPGTADRSDGSPAD